MFRKKLLTLTSLSLLLMQVSCGNKDAEDVNIKNFEWTETTDGKAILYPSSSLALKGDIEGNKPFVVSFAITDSSGKEIKQDSQRLYITHTPPQSGKKSLSLADDMRPAVNAGSLVCNGFYTVNIIAKTGQASVSKPQHFEVRNGLDASKCANKQSNNNSFKTAKISNRWGPDPSAFDLVEGHNLGHDVSLDSRKDLADLTLQANAKRFKRTLGSKNGSLFVQTANLRADSTDADIQSAYASGFQKVETDVLNAGDFVIVKTPRDFNSLYFIRIIYARQDEPSDKPGKHRTGAIKFEYRKISSSNNS